MNANERMLAEVIGFSEDDALLMPYGQVDGLRPRMTVVGLGRTLRVPVGPAVIGRVLNALGTPIDMRGRLSTVRFRKLISGSPAPMNRGEIVTPFETGQRAIDGLLTMGNGQRVGLFAGSGVGKSTLLGEIAKHASSDINVVALVGERGREVRPFLEESLGEEGLRRSVVVVATSDEPPLMRLRAAQTAVTIANEFREEGRNVMLMLDSLTRLAHAQREIGLMLGEPPTARGYTPSVFQNMANLLEQLGQDRDGSITALVTVLVDGDDTEEPVSDAARSILDGHIVLDRKLAQAGHYPAIDIGQSVSRLFNSVNDKAHIAAGTKVRSIIKTLAEMEDLIRLGLYTKGSSEQIDTALSLQPAINTLLQQSPGEVCSYAETHQALLHIGNAWRW
jgi:flagellum-specific ATP synthase